MGQLGSQERPRVLCAVHVDSKGRRVEPQPKVTNPMVRSGIYGAGSESLKSFSAPVREKKSKKGNRPICRERAVSTVAKGDGQGPALATR